MKCPMCGKKCIEKVSQVKLKGAEDTYIHSYRPDPDGTMVMIDAQCSRMRPMNAKEKEMVDTLLGRV